MVGEGWCRTTSSPSSRPCFNEAPIIWSGKDDQAVRTGLGALASMRPRSYGRGRMAAQVGHRRDLLASMRPRSYGRGRESGRCNSFQVLTGFNEAPIIWSGKVPIPPSELHRLGRASMRPRSYGRGRPGRYDAPTGRNVASMRPRSYGRGRFIFDDDVASGLDWLQ